METIFYASFLNIMDPLEAIRKLSIFLKSSLTMNLNPLLKSEWSKPNILNSSLISLGTFWVQMKQLFTFHFRLFQY